MEIKKLNGKSLNISGKDVNLVVFADDKTLKDQKPNIVLGGSYDGAFNVNSPGEYETHEVWIMAIPSNIKEDKLDIFVLNIEEVRVGIIDSTVKSLTKKQIEKIGIIDILIVDASEDLNSKMDLISEIDPQVVVPIGVDEEAMAKFTKELGVKDIQEDKKLKAKMEDFSVEDYQVKLFKLL